MKILHICSYYIGNKLYSHLFTNISKSNINQDVYIPIRNKSLIGKNKLDNSINVSFHYSNLLNLTDRIFFTKKIRKQIKDLENKIEVKDNFDFIHAHTLFSDGCTAYFLHKKYGIKYIINVRNTDINFFWKYGIHLRKLMNEILINAEKIVFLSPAYEKRLLSLVPFEIKMEIKDRCEVIPNGIEDFWIDAPLPKARNPGKETIKVLYIGELNKNKNVKSIIKACALQKEKGITITLEIVGEGPSKMSLVKLADSLGLKSHVNFHGYISDKSELMKIMDYCDIFVMPSIKETFGLVYIEAMSRGLPVIFSKGQAIDGFFKNGEIGFSVNPLDSTEIFNSIQLIIKNYTQISSACIIESNKFDWKIIKNRYIAIYEKNKI